MPDAPADAKPADNPAPKTDDQKPEEQPAVRGKILTDEEHADWGNEVSIEEKAPKTEKNILRAELEDAANPKDKPEDKAEKVEPDDAEPPEELEPPELLAVEVPENPGEFQPPDLSFEITTF